MEWKIGDECEAYWLGTWTKASVKKITGKHVGVLVESSRPQGSF
jgi:hypothetical protein